MIWYRGVNFFPSAVEQIVRGQGGLSPEYLIVVDDGEKGLPLVTVQVEALEAAAPDELRGSVRAALRGGLGVNPEVQVLPPAHCRAARARRRNGCSTAGRAP